MGNLLELYDLDGTLTTMDIFDPSTEVSAYFAAVVSHLDARLPEVDDATIAGEFDRILKGEVFPRRHELPFWSTFPSAGDTNVRICPAVDHYLLAQATARVYLEGLSEEGNQEARAILGDNNWSNAMYGECSMIAVEDAELDPEAIEVLDARLRAGALAVVYTNSKTRKAEMMLERAGFGDYLEIGRAKAGRIGVVGDAQKWRVNQTWEGSGNDRFGHVLNLTPFYGFDVHLDLRREHFHDTTEGLMQAADASEVWMVSDVPGLDLYPLANWQNINPRVAMKTNPTSAPQSIEAARRVLRIEPSNSISELVKEVA